MMTLPDKGIRKVSVHVCSSRATFTKRDREGNTYNKISPEMEIQNTQGHKNIKGESR